MEHKTGIEKRRYGWKEDEMINGGRIKAKMSNGEWEGKMVWKWEKKSHRKKNENEMESKWNGKII